MTEWGCLEQCDSIIPSHLASSAAQALALSVAASSAATVSGLKLERWSFQGEREWPEHPSLLHATGKEREGQHSCLWPLQNTCASILVLKTASSLQIQPDFCMTNFFWGGWEMCASKCSISGVLTMFKSLVFLFLFFFLL